MKYENEDGYNKSDIRDSAEPFCKGAMSHSSVLCEDVHHSVDRLHCQEGERAFSSAPRQDRDRKTTFKGCYFLFSTRSSASYSSNNLPPFPVNAATHTTTDRRHDENTIML